MYLTLNKFSVQKQKASVTTASRKPLFHQKEQRKLKRLKRNNKHQNYKLRQTIRCNQPSGLFLFLLNFDAHGLRKFV